MPMDTSSGFGASLSSLAGSLTGKAMDKSPSKKADDGKAGGYATNNIPGAGYGAGKGFYGSDIASYHKGGIVRKTGPAVLKKGERVLTKKQDTAYKKKNRK